MLRLGSTLLDTACLCCRALLADDAREKSFEQVFDKQIVPLIKTHCLSCHDAETTEAELDLTLFGRLRDVTRSHRVWEKILERVEAGEMPPDDATSMPSDHQRRTLVKWIRDLRQFEAARHAGDPGEVFARRLSNAEYDYSIRDLTGVDIRPTKTFPVDPANQAGFDNSGESLTMSTALMMKYLQAARTVVDHLVLTPRGMHFAPHSVATDTDRDKYLRQADCGVLPKPADRLCRLLLRGLDLSASRFTRRTRRDT